MIRIAMALAIVIASTGAVHSDDVVTSGCGYDEVKKIQDKRGEQLIGEESFIYESRVEESDDNDIKFIYCIKNKTKYTVLDVKWQKNDNNVYFVGLVQPNSEKPMWRESGNRKFLAATRSLNYSSSTIEPETLVSENEIEKSDQKTLSSGGFIDVPVNEKIFFLMLKGEYKEYSPKDFLPMRFNFTSRIIQSDGTKHVAENRVTLRVQGDQELAKQVLTDYPKAIATTDAGIDASFWKSTQLEDGKLKIGWDTDEIVLTKNTVSWEGPIREHVGVVQLNDFSATGSPYAVIGVSYFGP